MSQLSYHVVTNFNTPYADQIADIMIREWGYNYIYGFGFASIAEYKLWKDDSIFVIATENARSTKVIGMIAFERYNMAGNSRFTPCICCLYVDPDFRNQGIGEALLINMQAILTSSGYREAYAWVLNTDIGFWFELRGWRYVTEYIYLDRRVLIMRCDFF
jgi:ribosomal protein S18 acetylase RimI-like enzyme